MISAWHLLWIIPVCNCLFLLAVSMCSANAWSERITEAYNAGLQAGRNEAKNNVSQT